MTLEVGGVFERAHADAGGEPEVAVTGVITAKLPKNAKSLKVSTYYIEIRAWYSYGFFLVFL